MQAYAFLRVIARTVLVNGDGSKWKEVVTVKPAHNQTNQIKNPKPPVFQVQQCTYTNSDFPTDLDEALVNKHKSVKLQKMVDDKNEDEDEMIALGEITSVNQIHMTCSHPKKNTSLDDIFIPLPLMLEWICDEGWKLEHTSDRKYTNTFIFKRV